MSRLTVSLPDELADRARAFGLNVSSTTRKAVEAALEAKAGTVWLYRVSALPRPGSTMTRSRKRSLTLARRWGRTIAAEGVVVDASAVIELLTGTDCSDLLVSGGMFGANWHAPAHLPLEVFSVLQRLANRHLLADDDVEVRMSLLAEMPLLTHPVALPLHGARDRQNRLPLLDALYVELADQLHLRLITTDTRQIREVANSSTIL